MFLSTIEFYKDGFFGYGEKGDFKYFSFWHFLPIIILIAAIILTYIYRKKLASYKHEKHVRFILGCAILLFEAGYYLAFIICRRRRFRVYYTFNKIAISNLRMDCNICSINAFC